MADITIPDAGKSTRTSKKRNEKTKKRHHKDKHMGTKTNNLHKEIMDLLVNAHITKSAAIDCIVQLALGLCASSDAPIERFRQLKDECEQAEKLFNCSCGKVH